MKAAETRADELEMKSKQALESILAKLDDKISQCNDYEQQVVELRAEAPYPDINYGYPNELFCRPEYPNGTKPSPISISCGDGCLYNVIDDPVRHECDAS